MVTKHATGSILCFLIAVSLYILFPSVYVSLSQPLFVFLYGYNAPPVTAPEPGYTDGETLRVLARPPQTPYDTMLVRGPEEDVTGRYVYTDEGLPVGYVHERRGSLYTVVLFSSSLSGEVFSVDGYVTEGKGAGSGGFRLSVPIQHEVSPGMPVIHQHTGRVAGFVTHSEEVPERNINRVTAVITVNPLRTSVLYIPADGGGRQADKPAEILKDALRGGEEV